MNSPSSKIVRKRSVFKGFASYVETRKEAEAFLNSIKLKNKEASHNVCAYLIFETNLAYCSDDGEPSRTAGEPVLNVLKKTGFFIVCVVVSRYFGGTLLGTGGLVEAYSSACKAVFENAVLARCCLCAEVEIEIAYASYSKLQFLLKTFGVEVLRVNFASSVEVKFLIEFSKFEQFKSALQQKVPNGFSFNVLSKKWSRIKIKQSELEEIEFKGKKINK